MWPNRRVTDLLELEHPIIQAPMGGVGTTKLAAAVSEAGGLGSLSLALMTVARARAECLKARELTNRPINLNFFCHISPKLDAAQEQAWRHRLAPYYQEHGLELEADGPPVNVASFDDAWCCLVEELRPKVVSFHFGLPEPRLLNRVLRTGARVLSSATTVEEARWLEARGVDAVIAQGAEAGGHRGMFLTDSLATQVGTFALIPQVADAVRVPVIAAGGIGDARGIVAAFALGASAVVMGTAYLLCPEAGMSDLYRAGLRRAEDVSTALTNVFSGRAARAIANRVVREVGPISPVAPPFPLAIGAMLPIRATAEASGSSDFTAMWAGQAASLAREMSAGELTRTLAKEALAHLDGLARPINA